MKPRPLTLTQSLLLALAAVLAVSGCGVVGGHKRSATAQQQPEAVAGSGLTTLGRELPARIRATREIRVGADISYAPLEFYNALAPDVLARPAGGPAPEVQGIDPDLAAALGRKLGVRFTFVSVGFDDLLNSLRGGQIDVIISGMSATADRAKLVSFVEYFKAGTSIVVRKASASGVRSLQDLCGKTVAVQAGTTQEELANTQHRLCGTKGLTVRSLPSGSQVLLQVKHRQADAALVDFPVAAYNAKVSSSGSDFAVVGNQIDPGPFGVGVRKNDGQLREVLRTALEQTLADGSYRQVLARWNVTDGAVTSAGVLGAP